MKDVFARHKKAIDILMIVYIMAAMDKVYKSLAEINRRKIVFWLSLGEMSVGEIVKKMNISQATVSSHLALLKKSGLVESRILGKKRIYKLNSEKAKSFVREINRLMSLENQIGSDEIIIRR